MTSFQKTFEYLFIKQLFEFPEDYIVVVEHTAAMLRYPYGLLFSCFKASGDVFVFRTKIPEDQINEKY